MKKIFKIGYHSVFIAIFFCCITHTEKSYGQSKCDRITPFTADFLFQTNGKRLNSSVNFGFFSNEKISLQLGGRIYDTDMDLINKKSQQKINLTPTFTTLLKHRFNGEYSKIIHSIGVTFGADKYKEISYRLYGNPSGNSFATLGVVVSYNNRQGITGGFVIMGIF